MTADTTDEALVRRAKGGDPEAFSALVGRHQDVAYRLALRMVGPHAAEDVAQQAFLKAWQSLERFAGQAAFRTWLYRIVMNLCFDHLRRAGRYAPIPLDDLPEGAVAEQDVATTVELAAEHGARRAALAWALDHLPTEDRFLLSLRTGEGLSYEAIGELLGLNPRTVGTRLFRARARLHHLVVQRLEETGHDLP